MTSSVRTSSSNRKSFGFRSAVKTLAVVLSLAMPAMIIATAADARVGGGISSGSRGSRTFSAPPSTRTAPTASQPFQRTITQPGVNAPAATAAKSGGLFGGLSGRGLLGGLAAGFLGAGLLGMLFGGGLFGGLGGLSSIFGLLIQVVLIVIVARLVYNWWQRRNASTYVGAMPGGGNAPPNAYARDGAPSGGFGGAGGFGFGGGNAAPKPIEIAPADYDAFEKLLGDVQAAWSNEDVNRLHTLATPEMVSYFTQDLQANNARGAVNKVTDVKLLQGDLAEAWREGTSDYATVAMRYSLVDKTLDRASGRVVEGNDQPQEVTEVWTFVRPSGGPWELSAIQQV